ncbi:MAG: DUF5312 family protein [Treponema sp.]
MVSQRSTFDTLVDTLSTEEAQTMLINISASMKNNADIQQQSALTPFVQTDQRKLLQLGDEPLLVRVWLRIKAFFTSTQIEALYECELLHRIGKILHQNYKNYINIKKNLFLTDFYDMLRGLRKTQLFFTSLLSAYDSEKGNFYILVSSFAAPEVYSQLIHSTDPFSVMSAEKNANNQRADFMKRIDDKLSLITPVQKAEMYQCAASIEWIKKFCELPIDKIILRFTVNSPVDTVCPIQFIGMELEEIATVLGSAATIPNTVLQALFLLSKQDRMNDKSLDLKQESVEFISDASYALEGIKSFTATIPIADFARYAASSINWEPKSINGGEDWFLLFKNAWKKRFSEKWQLWMAEQKKNSLREQMYVVLSVTEIPRLKYRPWENAWIDLWFKREFIFTFLASFFSGLYTSTTQPVLNILLLEGNFCRRENLAEYTNAFTTLEKQKEAVEIFEMRLSPEGEIGSAFLAHTSKNIPSLKAKTGLENLMRNVETDAKQIITSSLNALKMICSLLNGFIEGNKSSVYATLSNWGTIQGGNNSAFRAQVEAVQKQLEKITVILTDAELIEKES